MPASASRLVDAEACDATEQQFAASLETKPTQREFVVDELQTYTKAGSKNDGEGSKSSVSWDSDSSDTSSADEKTVETEATDSRKPDLSGSGNSDSWRGELAAKVNHYRASRRPRAPRYPSLQLKFETPDSGATVRALPLTEELVPRDEDRVIEQNAPPVSVPTAKIIEFPVFSAPPPAFVDELAAPVRDRPRIFEVPEVVPPPPALGGILIDPIEESAHEKRQGFELPLIAAPFSRRILAAGIDSALVLSAVAMFGSEFYRISAAQLPWRQAAGVAGALLAIFWAGYEFLHLVYAGATPGLMLMKLRLARFDGSPVPRQLRRWRVLASLLSGLSLGLGYAWCFLDEDQLCWHDRITHTYMAPKTSK